MQITVKGLKLNKDNKMKSPVLLKVFKNNFITNNLKKKK